MFLQKYTTYREIRCIGLEDYWYTEYKDQRYEERLQELLKEGNEYTAEVKRVQVDQVQGLLSHCWPTDNFELCSPVGRPKKKVSKEIYAN
ncbi:hypothetical protein PROFUN_00029 [Planoprotostelium fungivorum]|uniref:Uncharacterized protein n=1 Tax=Planoprotostelium fungivorum TaxID=1890364 RepID=A0A2P6P0H4_9EUKA|nr:hypothetical protein PROFUN_00029 [Planoprotostelium fungivorum]